MRTTADYELVRVVMITQRLLGKPQSPTAVALSNYCACPVCGAPKGFICLEWEARGGLSHRERFDIWDEAGRPGKV